MPETLSLFGISVILNAQFFFLLLVVFIAGGIRGFTGFGSALVTVPALTAIYGPTLAVPIAVLIEVPLSLYLLPVAVRGAERSTVLPLMVTFLIFVPIGALFLKVVDPEIVKILISVLVLFFVGILTLQDRLNLLRSRVGLLAAGIFSGLSQGMVGMAGPLFVTALLARGERASQTRANIAAVAGALIAMSVLSLLFFGLITIETLVHAVIAVPAVLTGVWAGAWLFDRFSQWNLRWVILVFLTITALVTLVRALA